MKFNSDSTFVGLDKLKQTHQAQVADFEGWASESQWEIFIQLYWQQLMRKGEPMTFNGKDLSWLFTTGIDPY